MFCLTIYNIIIINEENLSLQILNLIIIIPLLFHYNCTGSGSGQSLRGPPAPGTENYAAPEYLKVAVTVEVCPLLDYQIKLVGYK
jgi:hypothetical protein